MTVEEENTQICACRGDIFIMRSVWVTCWTRKVFPLHIACPADHHMEIRISLRLGDGSCIISGSDNGSGQLASSAGWDHKNPSVQFQTQPITRPAASWWAQPIPIPGYLRVWKCLARPVGSNLWVCNTCLLFMIAFRHPTVYRKR
jgi:hypothetical protein